MSVPKLHPVDSSCVARIGYDPAAEEVYVEFHDSGTYAYCGISALVFDELARAESKGTFLNEVIKPRYPFRKLRARPSSR
jgi:KTSC domain-containing protein